MSKHNLIYYLTRSSSALRSSNSRKASKLICETIH